MLVERGRHGFVTAAHLSLIARATAGAAMAMAKSMTVPRADYGCGDFL
jgi:hypothetical protein